MMQEQNRQNMGERLLQLRMEHNLTQEDVAERLDVSRQSVSKWELDKTYPDVDKLLMLSNMYQVSLDELVKGSNGQSIDTEKKIEELLSEQVEESVVELEPDLNTTKSLMTSLVKNILMIGAIFSGLLLVCMIMFTSQLLSAHVFQTEGKNQDITSVDKIYEQYTKAEVTAMDGQGNFVKKVVWLDVPGVQEHDFITHYMNKEGHGVYFQYYSRTILIAAIVTVILGIIFVAFIMQLYINVKDSLNHG